MSGEVWSVWEAEHELLATRVSGNVTTGDIATWQDSLQAALAHISENGSFKLLVDLTGYELQDMAAHKAMRVVIPQLLAAYGLRAAVLGLFPEVEVTPVRTRGIACRAVANVHHDVDKMAEYERTLAQPNQRFFTDAGLARTWLLALD